MTNAGSMLSKAPPPVVLIVDDDSDTREMYTAALSMMGFQPITAATAQDGFEQACAAHPDAVVTDIGLPSDSGLELSRRLRHDTRTRDVGIILLTGHPSPVIEHLARQAGCDRYLTKPCLPDALVVEICDVIASRNGM